MSEDLKADILKAAADEKSNSVGKNNIKMNEPDIVLYDLISLKEPQILAESAGPDSDDKKVSG